MVDDIFHTLFVPFMKNVDIKYSLYGIMFTGNIKTYNNGILRLDLNELKWEGGKSSELTWQS